MMSRRRVCLPASGSSAATVSGRANWGLMPGLHKGASVMLGTWVFIRGPCEDPHLTRRVEGNGATFPRAVRKAFRAGVPPPRASPASRSPVATREKRNRGTRSAPLDADPRQKDENSPDATATTGQSALSPPIPPTPYPTGLRALLEGGVGWGGGSASSAEFICGVHFGGGPKSGRTSPLIYM